MLSKKGIEEELERGCIFVEGSEIKLAENYIDVTLGNTIKIYATPTLDVTEPSPTIEIPIPEEGLILKPNELYLGRTFEFTKTYGFVPLLSGTEELAAIGMEIHITAGFGDNGFEGTWTLEIVCSSPTRIYSGMKIGELYYYPLIGNPGQIYRGKYFGQIEPTASKLSEEYNENNKGKVLTKKC